MQSRWITPAACDPTSVGALRRELGLPAALAGILVRRGFSGILEAGDFLDPKLKSLTPPEELPGVAEAAERLLRAVSARERIVIYGDYDVDGVTSLALLWRILRGLGANAECFLPLRAEEGYGLSVAGVTRCCEEFRPDLLVAVDCGTNSADEIALLAGRGVEALVIDHHEPSGCRPGALVVNPKLTDSPLRYLCSAGVVFKVAHALLKRSPDSGLDLREYLDLVALATVADVVPLVGENRILVRRGLLQIPRTRWPGVRALLESAAVTSALKGSDIGFRLGPRINASGRLGTALESLRLLTTDDPVVATAAAASLERQNRERQNVERAVSLEAEHWVSERFDPSRDASIVAGAREWHQGVLGIVASRLARRHHRPTVVIGFGEDGMGKGSGRSVEGFSLVDALSRCGELLEKFGGHELAAGLSIREEHFEKFRSTFESVARAGSDAEMLTPRLDLDSELEIAEINDSFLSAQERMEPFGCGNSQPVFFARGIRPVAEPRVLKEKHLRFDLPVGRSRLAAIYFNGVEAGLARPPWDLAFRVERNTFAGRDEPQLQIIAMRASS